VNSDDKALPAQNDVDGEYLDEFTLQATRLLALGG
jgi:hypothetical protein